MSCGWEEDLVSTFIDSGYNFTAIAIALKAVDRRPILLRVLEIWIYKYILYSKKDSLLVIYLFVRCRNIIAE